MVQRAHFVGMVSKKITQAGTTRYTMVERQIARKFAWYIQPFITQSHLLTCSQTSPGFYVSAMQVF